MWVVDTIVGVGRKVESREGHADRGIREGRGRSASICALTFI